MAVAIDAVGCWTERRRRVSELRTRQGFARQLLDFYGALLSVQEKAYFEAIAASPPAGSLAAYVTEVVVPSVIDVSISAGPERMRSELIHRLEVEQPGRMVEGWLEGENQTMIDRFLARASVGPVLEALGGDARGACVGPRDGRHCPECGGPPQLSFFTVPLEDLAGGARRLLCARCGVTWSYARMTCPGCGEDSSSKLPIFSEHGTASGERGSVVRGMPGAAAPDARAVFPHMRIEACEACRRYLLSIDQATEPRAVPVVDELAAIPLDLLARDRGFTKITSNLMGF
jgi:hypothetical protein